MKRINKRSKRNLLIGFGFSLLILIISSIISYISINQLIDSQRWVEHTTQVKLGLDQLISRMKDAETGQRGFLLTGEETFLEPYNGARSEVMELIANTQMLTRDNDTQQRDFPFLEKLISDKFNLIAGSIRDKKQGIPPTSSALLKGKAVMDSVRVIVATMIKRENKLMITRNAEMDTFATYTPIFIGIASLIAMVITIVFYFRVQKDAQIAVHLQNELIEKEKNTERQISAIGSIAEKIAKGDYAVRVDENDLK